MDALILVYLAVVGLCVGSFLNVVIARLPAGESVLRPRSRCPRCMAPIAWYDNVPLVSYLLLRARCRGCAAPIAVRYPLVELLMGALSVALYVRFGLSWELLRWWPVVAALLAIVFLDIDHWWVPDRITFPAMLWAAGFAFAPDGVSPVQAVVGLAPAVCVLVFGWLFMKLTGREGIGLGDIKLLVLMGLMLGAWQTLLALLAASLQGALVGTVVTLFGGHRSAATPMASDDGWVPPPRAIPFGPFLVLGVIEVLLVPGLASLPFRLTSLLLPSP